MIQIDSRSALLDRLCDAWSPQAVAVDHWSRDPAAMWVAAGKQPDPWQLAVTNSTAQQILMLCSRQSGKALALDTPIYTPDGWTTMENVRVGDLVFTEDGERTSVIAVSPVMEHESYRVVFSDGETIVADADHQWTVLDKPCRVAMERNEGCIVKDWPTWQSIGKHRFLPRTKTLTTREMSLSVLLNGKESNYAVPAARPLSYGHEDPFEAVERHLSVDPYVLGVWLGDGHSESARITSADPEVFVFIAEAGYTVCDATHVKHVTKAEVRGIGKGVHGGKHREHTSLTRTLSEMGLIGNKRIPRSYLTASVHDRIRLLQGLMDTDGWVSETVNTCEFSNTNKRLVGGFVELANSLGIITSVKEVTAFCNGKNCGPHWRIHFNPWFQVFRIPRKAERLHLESGRPSRRRLRYIRDIVPNGKVKVKCISVASSNKLYLAGRGMIPTHNSTSMAAAAYHTAVTKPGSTTLIISRSLRQAAELKRKVDEFHFAMQGQRIGWRGAAKRLTKYQLRSRDEIDVPGADLEDAVRNSVLGLELGNGSRILAMPCMADTMVGYTIDLLIYDEAARIPDAVYYLMRQTVARAAAAGKSRLIAASTPNGKMGWFWEEINNCREAVAAGREPAWECYNVVGGRLGTDGAALVGDCGWLTRAFLQRELESIGQRWYRQEYGCEFVDALDQVFAQADIDRALRVVDDGFAAMEDV